MGATIAGISVQRTFCRNTNITRKTSAMASSRVTSTFSMEMRTKGAVSKGIKNPMPSGIALASSVIRAAMAEEVVTALAPGASWTASVATGLPLERVAKA